MTSNCTLPRRLMAMLYDAFLLGALLFLGTLPFIAARAGEPVDPGDAPYQITLFAISWLFFAGFWSLAGRTLGMQSWGLRLEDCDGNTPGFSRATVRFLAAILSWLPLGLGFLWQLWDRDRLAWHDRISRTRLQHYPRR